MHTQHLARLGTFGNILNAGACDKCLEQIRAELSLVVAVFLLLGPE
jgi:hypothetical protein